MRAAMFRVRSQCVAVAILAGVLTLATPVAAADVVLYRVFLLDGSNVVSYGEFARIAGTVVFSVPVGGLETESPRLQLVSLPEATVDWPRTEAYAEAARAKRFAETRGEAEFSRLSEEVARTLNQIAFMSDPARRLATVERARRLLVDWPAQNYWYRAYDVADLTALLDGVRADLRAAAGEPRFDLELVASAAPPPAVPMLAAPSLREGVEQAFLLVRLSQDAAQRSSLLRVVTEALAGPAGEGGWAAALRARATADLVVTTRTDQAYADLAARLLRTADQKARRGDVKGMEGVIREVLKADDALGRQRPLETAALLATLDGRLTLARQARLAQDQWSVRSGVARAYDRRTRRVVNLLARARPSLEAIRHLAGPSPKALQQLETSVATAAREFSLVKPPPELDTIHGLLTNAFQMAVRAAATRTSAVRSNDLATAWQASSAAAGALLLLDRARDEIKRLTRSSSS